MEGFLSPAHVFLLIGGSICVLFGVGAVLLIVFLTRRGNKDEKLLLSLKEENDHLREEIERLKRRP